MREPLSIASLLLVYSFWAPLDAKFLRAMVALGRTQGFEYVSPFWSTYFFGYAEYSSEDEDAAPRDLIRKANQLAARNVREGRLSASGEAYSREVKGR